MPQVESSRNQETVKWNKPKILIETLSLEPGSPPKYLFTYFEVRASEHEWRRGRDRIPTRLHAVSTEADAGLEPMNCEIMTWAEIKSQTLNQLSHPCAPEAKNFLLFVTSKEAGSSLSKRCLPAGFVQKVCIQRPRWGWGACLYAGTHIVFQKLVENSSGRRRS